MHLGSGYVLNKVSVGYVRPWSGRNQITVVRQSELLSKFQSLIYFTVTTAFGGGYSIMVFLVLPRRTCLFMVRKDPENLCLPSS